MIYYVISALIVAADQLTKWLARVYLADAGEVETLPGLMHLCFSLNDGASLGMLGGRRWLLVALSAAAAVLIAVLMAKRFFSSRAELWGVSFVLGGAVGNLIDRASSGYVTDMLIFPWIGKIPLMPDFICNVADIFITFGAVIFIVGYIVAETKKARAERLEKTRTHDAEV